MDARLREWWCFAVTGCGADPERSERQFRAVCIAYGQPHRRYHTLDHVRQMLESRAASLSAAVIFACFFHDVVYRSWLPRNEERSARAARRALRAMGAGSHLVAEVEHLVLATKDHASAPHEPELDDFLDRDLSILGSDRASYEHYTTNVAKEYAWLPTQRYRDGRRRFLAKLLASERIFRTPRFFQELEVPTRENLVSEVASLERLGE